MKHPARLLLLFASLAGGCQSAVPRPDVAAAAAAALGDVAVRVTERPAEGVDAGAGEGGDPSLAPGEAVRRAVLHDPRLQAALAHVRSASADAHQARLFPNPILSVSMRFRNGEDPIVDAALAGDLVALLQRPRRISAADARLRGAAAEVLTALADVVSDVQESYAAVQALGGELAALEERGRLARRLVELGRARLQAGEAGRTDSIALETQAMQLDVEAAEKRQDLAEARLGLARLVGEPSSAAAWTLAPWEPPPAPRAAEAAWVEAALRNRAELRSKQWELSALGDEAALARFAIWEGGEFGVQSELDRTWSAGPGAVTPLPLFDWGQAKREKAGAELAQARHQATLLRRQVVQEVRTQYSAYNASLRTLTQARDQLLPLQEKRSSQTEASYKAGETDVATLLLAEEDLLDTRVKVIGLQRKTALARIKLQRAVGGIGAAAAVEARGGAAAAPTAAPTAAPAAPPAGGRP